MTTAFNDSVEFGVSRKFDGHVYGYGRYEPDIGDQDILWAMPCPNKEQALHVAASLNACLGMKKPDELLVAVYRKLAVVLQTAREHGLYVAASEIDCAMSLLDPTGLRASDPMVLGD